MTEAPKIQSYYRKYTFIFEPMSAYQTWTCHLALGMCLLFTGCESLPNIMAPKLPEAKVTDVRITNASFKGVELMFDVDLVNSNPFALNLQGASYGLSIDGNRLFAGSMPEPVQMKPSASTPTTLSLEVPFDQILGLAISFKDQDEFEYLLDGGFDVRIPGLGLVNIPVSYEGVLPILKAPMIRSVSVRQQSLNLAGTKLVLRIEMANPNGFGMDLDRLDYKFNVNQTTWAEGVLREKVSLDPHSNGLLEIPVSLSFLDVGVSLYRMLSDKSEADYQLEGMAKIGSSLPYLEELEWPMLHEGRFTVR